MKNRGTMIHNETHKMQIACNLPLRIYLPLPGSSPAWLKKEKMTNQSALDLFPPEVAFPPGVEDPPSHPGPSLPWPQSLVPQTLTATKWCATTLTGLSTGPRRASTNQRTLTPSYAPMSSLPSGGSKTAS